MMDGPDRQRADEYLFAIEGGIAHPTAFGAGPWDPSMLHGGAPAALIAHIAETMPAPIPMRLARLTVELTRPVPIRPLRIATEVTREGRNVQTIAMTLLDEEKPVVRAFALKVRTAALDLPSAVEALTSPHAFPPDDAPLERFGDRGGYNDGVAHHWAAGGFDSGRGAAWFRYLRPFVKGVPTSPLMRAAATADYCNGISSYLDFEKWTFINADITVHVFRPPEGEWILLDAECWLGPDGAGVAFGALADLHGVFGRSAQTLVIGRR